MVLLLFNEHAQCLSCSEYYSIKVPPHQCLVSFKLEYFTSTKFLKGTFLNVIKKKKKNRQKIYYLQSYVLLFELSKFRENGISEALIHISEVK